MNTPKTTPLLAAFIMLFMAAPASAQVIAQARVNVEVNVGNANQKSQRGGHKDHKKDKRDNRKRSSQKDSNRNHKKKSSDRTRHTVVHEHVIVHEHVQPAAPQYYPMADGQFAGFIAQINDEPFSSGKLGVISMAADYNYFTSAQVRQVVSALTFSSDRVEAAVLLYARVLDPEVFYQVFSAFTFESSKTEVRARLGI